jgi:hypothetical protein
MTVRNPRDTMSRRTGLWMSLASTLLHPVESFRSLPRRCGEVFESSGAEELGVFYHTPMTVHQLISRNDILSPIVGFLNTLCEIFNIISLSSSRALRL